MIWIAGRQVNPMMLQDWGLNDVQQEIVHRMAASRDVFEYASEDVLRFELKLRDHLVKSARALYMSGIAFSDFENSRSNPEFWEQTELGGFRLRPGVPPSRGIIDIFQNGNLYATECATAMVIILYHAVLQSIREADFERLFADIVLYDWRYDQDLNLQTLPTDTFLPGDILYFANPDYDRSKPQWQGENAVFLGRGLYYGHGAGIRTAPSLIAFLNENREPGATRSAYLVSQATRPGFASLAPFDNGRESFWYVYRNEGIPGGPFLQTGGRIMAAIGSQFWEG